MNIIKLNKINIPYYKDLLTLFGDAFSDEETYNQNRPSDNYIEQILDSEHIHILVALEDNKVVGGLVAYELKKIEQMRSEMYIYDLAVDNNFRRRGVATSLINELKIISKSRNGYVIFVQADIDIEDEPARKLYSKLGIKEEVFHYDIQV
jgi:aminoglycoside 3-N-acetyltransferase I